jgi:diaminopimelate decarboxylase
MKWWENEFASVRRGRLCLGDSTAEDLARAHGTPLYVYGAERLRANYRKLAAVFESATDLEVRVCYALKANSHPAILRILRGEGGWVDAVSPGEVRAALAAGFPPERILFTGTSVGERDLREVFAVDGLVVNIDALEQIEAMRRARGPRRDRRPIRVSVRWNPGLGRGFNPKVVTAGERTSDGTPIKFGVEEAKLSETFRRAASAGFEPIGLHQHLGSGWLAEDYPVVLTAVDKMVDRARELERAGHRLEFLDFGGGFGPRYAREHRLFPVERYARHIARRVREAGLGVRALAVEPGKYLAADAGALLLRVEYVKESYGNLFACVDGGTFNTLPRPAIYSSARHEIVLARGPSARPARRYTVAGHLCETGDVFGREVRLPTLRAGDILAVLQAGAYGRSMASTFNLRPIPPEVLV